MPGIATAGESRALKRKRDAASTLSTSSTTPSTHLSKHNEVELDVSILEDHILKSRQYYNNISTLIEYTRQSGESQNRNREAVIALCRIFSRLMARGSMTASQHVDENESMITEWLRRKYQEYCDNLLDSLANGTHEEQSASLIILMQLFKEEALGQKPDEESTWKKGTFISIVRAVVNSATGNGTREAFVDSYVKRFSDIKVYTFQALAYVW